MGDDAFAFLRVDPAALEPAPDRPTRADSWQRIDIHSPERRRCSSCRALAVATRVVRPAGHGPRWHDQCRNCMIAGIRLTWEAGTPMEGRYACSIWSMRRLHRSWWPSNPQGKCAGRRRPAGAIRRRAFPWSGCSWRCPRRGSGVRRASGPVRWPGSRTARTDVLVGRTFGVCSFKGHVRSGRLGDAQSLFDHPDILSTPSNLWAANRSWSSTPSTTSGPPKSAAPRPLVEALLTDLEIETIRLPRTS